MSQESPWPNGPRPAFRPGPAIRHSLRQQAKEFKLIHTLIPAVVSFYEKEGR